MIFAITLDEKTKKIILTLCIIFILILLIFGFIYSIITKYMEKESKKLDEYMYDLCTYKIVKNPKEFKKAVKYYERRSLFNNSKWAIRFIFLFTISLFIIGFFFFYGDYKTLFTKVFDLFPILQYQTVGQVNETLSEIEGATLIPGPSWMPISILPAVISKNPDFSDAKLYISTGYYIIMIFCFFKITRAILGNIARTKRGESMSKEVFRKKLDNLTIIDETTKQFNTQIDSNEGVE